MKVRKSNLQNVRAEYAKEQEKLSDLRAEVVKSIQGESVYSKEMLAGLVNEVDAKVKELEAVLKEAEREVDTSCFGTIFCATEPQTPNKPETWSPFCPSALETSEIALWMCGKTEIDNTFVDDVYLNNPAFIDKML